MYSDLRTLACFLSGQRASRTACRGAELRSRMCPRTRFQIGSWKFLKVDQKRTKIKAKATIEIEHLLHRSTIVVLPLLVLVLMGVLPNCFAAAAIVLPKLSKSTSVTRCRLTKPSIALSITLSICLDVPYCIRNFRTSKAFSFSLFWIDKSLSRRDCDIVERLEGMFDLRVERLVRRAMAFFEPMLSLGILILLDIGVPVRKHVELFLLVFFPQNRQRI